MKKVWLSIGSNLCNPLFQIERAILSLSKIPNTNIISYSSYYKSRPIGIKNQPDFLNAVIKIETKLSPSSLLSYIQLIEISQGRTRTSIRWSPRTIDIDILLFGTDIIKNSNLIIPHYDIYNRAFVLYPMLELSNNFIFPNGKLLKDVVRKVSDQDISFWKKNSI